MSRYYISASASWRHYYCRRKIARAHTHQYNHTSGRPARVNTSSRSKMKKTAAKRKKNKMETNRIGSNDTYAKCLHCEYIHVGMHKHIVPAICTGLFVFGASYLLYVLAHSLYATYVSTHVKQQTNKSHRRESLESEIKSCCCWRCRHRRRRWQKQQRRRRRQRNTETDL